MTSRAFLLSVILFGLLIFGLLAQSGQLLAFMVLFLVYLFAGIFFRPDEIRLAVSREISNDRVLHGAHVTIQLEIINEGSYLEEVLLEELESDHYALVDGAIRLITSLRPGEKLIWKYTLRADRGYYLFTGLRVKACDHFGLMNRSRSLKAIGRFMALPIAYKLRRIIIRPRKTKIYSGFIPARSGGQGVEFYGVREHQPSDPPRLINWKASARHQRSIFVNEFEQERVADVGLILDGRERSYEGSKRRSLFESSVSAAATLADACLNDGNRVGLFIYGRAINWTFPGYGKVQKERIMLSLANARPGEHQVFDKLENLPVSFFPALSQLIFISPLQKDDLPTLFLLRSRGYQVLVISPDILGLEKIKLNKIKEDDPDLEIGWRLACLERNLMLQRLKQAGVNVLNWQIDIPFYQTVNAYSNPRQPWQQ